MGFHLAAHKQVQSNSWLPVSPILSYYREELVAEMGVEPNILRLWALDDSELLVSSVLSVSLFRKSRQPDSNW